MILTVTNLPAMYREPGFLKARLDAGVRNGLHAAGVDAVGKVREAITTTSPRPPIDTGALRTGIVSVVAPAGNAVTIGPAPPVAGRGAVMEMGRRPGGRMPPIDPIFQWVHRKGLATRFLMGRRRQLSLERTMARKVSRGGAKLSRGKKAIQRDVELDLAFAIQRSIAKKGIRPRWFIRRALPGIRRDAPGLVLAGIARALGTARGA